MENARINGDVAVNQQSTFDLLASTICDASADLLRAEGAWNQLVEKICANPNQMNVYGIWQRDQLNELLTLHTLVIERARVVSRLKRETIETLSFKPVPKVRKGGNYRPVPKGKIKPKAAKVSPKGKSKPAKTKPAKTKAKRKSKSRGR